MRKVFGVAALVLTLSCPTFAGIIHNPAPQPPPTTTQDTNAGGEMHTPLTTAEIVLSLLSGLLPLL